MKKKRKATSTREHRKRSAAAAPSTSQEDYLETIFHLQEEGGTVLASAIAARLGVRRPPATRAIQALRDLGLVEHEDRRDVRLTARGRGIASALAHRHADLVYLLTEVLGVPTDVAESDTCQMEHGVSQLTAQRLHEFLQHFIDLDERSREALRPVRATAAFRQLPHGKGAGWRA